LFLVGDEDGHDTRCGACGSLLYSSSGTAPTSTWRSGSLRDAPSIRPSGHIYVGSKAPWFDITDDLPQHEEL
jgi:hypothetical protein